MTLQITEKSEQEMAMNALVDPKIQRISLVKSPANRTVFDCIRSTQAGENEMANVVHKVITKKGQTLLDVTRSDPSLAWLLAIRGEASGHGDEHSCFSAKEESQFKANSFEVVSITRGECPAWAIVGVLKDDADKSDAVVMGALVETQRADMPVSAKALMNGYNTNLSAATQAGDMFYSEFYSFTDVLHGLLGQSSIVPKARKAAIIATIDGFKNFMTFMLDTLDAASGVTEVQRSADSVAALSSAQTILMKVMSTLKADAPEVSKTILRSDNTEQSLPEVKDMPGFEFASREDFISAVAGTVNATLDARRAEEDKQAEVKRSADAAAAQVEIIRSMGEKIIALEAKIAGNEAAPAGVSPKPVDAGNPADTKRAEEVKPVEGLDAFAGFMESVITNAVVI